MAVVVTPLALEFHITGGVNGSVNINPFFSLGGQMARKISDDTFENLFDPISSLEARNGRTEYRWIVCLNTGTDSIRDPHFYFLPKDENVDIEFSRLAVSAPVTI